MYIRINFNHIGSSSVEAYDTKEALNAALNGTQLPGMVYEYDGKSVECVRVDLDPVKENVQVEQVTKYEVK